MARVERHAAAHEDRPRRRRARGPAPPPARPARGAAPSRSPRPARPPATSEMTSLSAKTVQVLETGTARGARGRPCSASLVERHAEPAQDHLEEAPGAGGALVVHGEVDDLAGRRRCGSTLVSWPPMSTSTAAAAGPREGAARVAGDLGEGPAPPAPACGRSRWRPPAARRPRLAGSSRQRAAPPAARCADRSARRGGRRCRPSPSIATTLQVVDPTSTPIGRGRAHAKLSMKAREPVLALLRRPGARVVVVGLEEQHPDAELARQPVLQVDLADRVGLAGAVAVEDRAVDARTRAPGGAGCRAGSAGPGSG